MRKLIGLLLVLVALAAVVGTAGASLGGIIEPYGTGARYQP